MRKPIILIVLLVSSIASAESRQTKQVLKTAKPTVELPRDLDPADVRDRMKVVDGDIAQCYLDTVGAQRGAGRLEIKLSIHRTGLIDSIDVTTPSISLAKSQKVANCVKAAVKGLAFPVRRAETVAIVPYFYQRTAAPASGPQYSCWNPKGCR